MTGRQVRAVVNAREAALSTPPAELVASMTSDERKSLDSYVWSELDAAEPVAEPEWECFTGTGKETVVNGDQFLNEQDTWCTFQMLKEEGGVKTFVGIRYRRRRKA